MTAEILFFNAFSKKGLQSYSGSDSSGEQYIRIEFYLKKKDLNVQKILGIISQIRIMHN